MEHILTVYYSRKGEVMEVWQYCAPAIDVIAPDIYVPNFLEICEEYTRRENPLFISETATHSHCGPREVYWTLSCNVLLAVWI